jgi:hypothetical protein
VNTGDNIFTKVVNIFNATAGSWSTASLSEARSELAATSLPNHGLAIFAGGFRMLCVGDFCSAALSLVCCATRVALL